MKKLFVLTILLVSAGWISAAGLKEAEPQSEIKEVTVYASNAHVSREAKLNIPEGTNIFKFKGLSPYINEQSLQVLGTGDIIIHSFHYEVNYISSIESDEKIKTLLSQIGELEKQILFKNSRLDVLKEQKDLLDKNKRLNENGLSVEELTRLVQYFDQKLTAISNEMLQMQFDIQDLEKEKQALNNQLNQHNQKEKTPSGEISVKIESRAEQTSFIEISYLATQAGWSPAYDIKIDDVESDINLVFKASLFNNTREDWKDVKLIFSNGNPNYSGVLPTLHPWYLDLYRTYIKGKGNRSVSMPAAVEMAMEAEDELREEDFETKPLATTYVEQQTTVEYVIDQPYTLMSNNESIHVDLKTYEIPSTYKYFAVPKLDRSAYLVASIRNWEQEGLLSGPANLYFQNRFVGKTFVNSQQLADTFNISLGQDRSIILKRELVTKFQKKNLIGTDRIDSRGYEITVRNTKSKPIDIVIYDQIPVSVNSRIDVSILDSGNAKVDEKSGRLTWERTISSGSALAMEFGYEVKYPKDEVVYLD